MVASAGNGETGEIQDGLLQASYEASPEAVRTLLFSSMFTVKNFHVESHKICVHLDTPLSFQTTL